MKSTGWQKSEERDDRRESSSRMKIKLQEQLDSPIEGGCWGSWRSTFQIQGSEESEYSKPGSRCSRNTPGSLRQQGSQAGVRRLTAEMEVFRGGLNGTEDNRYNCIQDGARYRHGWSRYRPLGTVSQLGLGGSLGEAKRNKEIRLIAEEEEDGAVETLLEEDSSQRCKVLIAMGRVQPVWGTRRRREGEERR